MYKKIKLDLVIKTTVIQMDEHGKESSHSEGTRSTVTLMEESVDCLRMYYDLDAVNEIINAWWRDLESFLPRKLEAMLRKALKHAVRLKFDWRS